MPACDVAARLLKRGLAIPELGVPRANFLPYNRSGNLVYFSGQVSRDNATNVMIEGHAESAEHGRPAAELAALNLIGAIKHACEGDLAKVTKIVRVEIFVASKPDFYDQPQVGNGCSDLLVDAFGEDVGRHARFAVGCSALPKNARVEIAAVVEIPE